MITGVGLQRGLVTSSRLGKSPGLAVDNPQFVVRNGMSRTRLQRTLQVLFCRFEVTGTMIGDAQIDPRCAEIGRRLL